MRNKNMEPATHEWLCSALVDVVLTLAAFAVVGVGAFLMGFLP